MQKFRQNGKPEDTGERVECLIPDKLVVRKKEVEEKEEYTIFAHGTVHIKITLKIKRK